MAKDLNKVQLTGRLGADPEPRFTPQGTAVTTFRVASNRRWKSSDGGDHEETEWFRVVAWNKLAEICRDYLRKGTRVYIEGRLQTRSWEDKDGQTKYMTEVVANDMILLDGRRENGYAPDGDAEVDFDPEPEPEATPARRAPAPQARNAAPAPAAQRTPQRSPAPSRGKPVVDEEDLPF